MSAATTLKGKKILIVDDELDVLDTLEGLLPMCKITKAGTFDSASKLLLSEPFDIAILDIMGVDGYKLLSIANEKRVIAVMLTAHAFSVDHMIRSYKEGAASYLPKDKITGIESFLQDVLEGKEQRESSWWRWLERFGDYYEKKFGPDWQHKDRDFWRKFPGV